MSTFASISEKMEINLARDIKNNYTPDMYSFRHRIHDYVRDAYNGGMKPSGPISKPPGVPVITMDTEEAKMIKTKIRAYFSKLDDSTKEFIMNDSLNTVNSLKDMVEGQAYGGMSEGYYITKLLLEIISQSEANAVYADEAATFRDIGNFNNAKGGSRRRKSRRRKTRRRRYTR